MSCRDLRLLFVVVRRRLPLEIRLFVWSVRAAQVFVRPGLVPPGMPALR